MRYSYRCEAGHRTEHAFAIGTAPMTMPCGCVLTARRDFAADVATQQIQGDPYRTYHLSSAKHRAQAEQCRIVGGPQDSVEKRAIEKSTGRLYIGNETGGMSKAAQRGIARERDRLGKKANR